MNRRINIVTGHFGSGKTEFAINMALRFAEQGKKVTIVDIDIVNTYFRTEDAREKLESMGIRVISPQFANTNLDMPTVPTEVLSVFADKESTVVFDVGGDADGAFALGQYKRFFDAEPYAMYFVVNACRPLTADAEGACEYMREIEAASRLRVTDLVNCTNLAGDTRVEDVVKGQAICEEMSGITGVPVSYVCAEQSLIPMLTEELRSKAFGLDLYLKLKF